MAREETKKTSEVLEESATLTKDPMTDLDEGEQKIVAWDLDGVLAHYSGWKGPDVIGSPINEIQMICHWLKKRGVKLILYTCRINKTLNREYGVDTRKMVLRIRDWLRDSGLGFVEISEDEGKPFAHIYIDDHVLLYRHGETKSKDLVIQIEKMLWGE